MLSLFPEGGKYIVPLSRYGELIDRYFHHRQRSRYCSSCGKYYLDDARTIDAINYIYLCENYDDHVGTHQDEGGQNFYLSVCNEHTRAPKDCQGLGFGPNGFPPTGCHHVPFGGMHKYTAMGCTHGSIDKLVFEDAACEKQAPPPEHTGDPNPTSLLDDAEKALYGHFLNDFNVRGKEASCASDDSCPGFCEMLHNEAFDCDRGHNLILRKRNLCLQPKSSKKSLPRICFLVRIDPP